MPNMTTNHAITYANTKQKETRTEQPGKPAKVE